MAQEKEQEILESTDWGKVQIDGKHTEARGVVTRAGEEYVTNVQIRDDGHKIRMLLPEWSPVPQGATLEDAKGWAEASFWEVKDDHVFRRELHRGSEPDPIQQVYESDWNRAFDMEWKEFLGQDSDGKHYSGILHGEAEHVNWSRPYSTREEAENSLSERSEKLEASADRREQAHEDREIAQYSKGARIGYGF